MTLDEEGSALIRVVTVVGIIAIIGTIMYGLYLDPTKTWMKQDKEMGALDKRIEDVEKLNQALTKEQEELMSDEYIEQKAREELGLIKPGEEAYVVVDPVKKQEAAPQNNQEPKKPSFIDKIKKFVGERNFLLKEVGGEK
jgi:cell division protein FtsB